MKKPKRRCQTGKPLKHIIKQVGSFTSFQMVHTHTLLHAETFTHKRFDTQTLLHNRNFYTQTLLHTEAFTHRRFYTTETFLHTDGFTHRRFYTQRLLHTEDFTHRSFYTQRLLHTEDCTHRSFYTDAFYTNAFTHRSFYTQTPLHTETCTQSTQKLLSRRFYTDAFTHRSFHTQHTEALYTQKKSQFYRSFWRSTLISCERVATGTRKSQFYLRF